MKNRCLILFGVLLLSLVFVSSLVNAQTKQQSQFGFVNISDVMLLHPIMVDFNPVSKRFKLEALKGIDKDKKIEENKLKFRVELNKLEDQIKEYNSKKVEIEEIYLEQSQNLLSDDKLAKMSKKDRDSYFEKRAKIDNKYCDEINDINNKIYVINEKIKNHKNSAVFNGDTTVEETDKLFSLMLDDIYEAMNSIAKKKNLMFVFNCSAELAINSGNMQVHNPLHSFFHSLKETLKNKDGVKTTGASIYAWLREKNNAFINCTDKRLPSFVMLGGYDMTADVIDNIYEKYKIGNEQREFIKDYYNKIAKSIED